MIAGRQADYGYRYNAARDGYEVHEAEMTVVRRIFRMIGKGLSVYGVRAALEETREAAKRELASLASEREELEAMERDRDLILESYAALAPEERRKVYVILNLTVEPLAGGGL